MGADEFLDEAPSTQPRYAPAPTTAEGAEARLADVASAEDDIRAWAESKRIKPGARAPAPAASSADGFLDERPSADSFLDEKPQPTQAEARRVDAATTPEAGKPVTRRGGTRSEATRASTAARESVGPTLPDPLLSQPGGRQPLPEGVMPSQAGGGRGFVNPMPAAVQRADSQFKNRDDAINDAVDRIEMGANPEDVIRAFERMGIKRQEIQQRGAQLGGKAFAPQTTRPANNELLAGPTGFDEIKPRDIGMAEDAVNALRRGGEQAKGTIDTGLFLGGVTAPADFAEQMRTSDRRMGALAPADATSAGLERLQEANKSGEWGQVLQAAAQPQNWRGLASMVMESAVASAPVMVAGSLATALGGAAAGMPVTAAASFAQEYAAALADEMEKRGVSPSDPAAVAALLQDPSFRQDIDNRGKIRGAAVGAFDSITMGFAGALGRSLRRAEQAGTLTKGRAIGGAAAGAGVEIGGGMAGERLAQAGVGENKPLDVLVEGLAEGPSGIVDVASGFLTPRSKPGEPVLPPSKMKAWALDRFGELAAAFGLSARAAERAKAEVSTMPAGDVPTHLAKVAEAYNKRNLFAKPLEPQAVSDLQQAMDGPPAPEGEQAVSSIEATLKAAGALPDQANEVQGLADEPTQPNPDAPVAGEPINREWTRFTPESGTLNIPREQMPQIAAEHRGALVNFLNARGVEHDMETVDPSTLKPTQAEFQPKKVAGIAEKGSGRSLLVSQDGHILDGHHQWMAAKETGSPVRVVRLQAPIQDLLRLAHQFPSSTTARGPSKTATAAPPASAADQPQGANDGQRQEGRVQAPEVTPSAPADQEVGATEQRAGAPNGQPELPVSAASVPGAGAAGPGAAGGRAGTVGPVAADAQRVAAGDPAATAGRGDAGADAGRGDVPNGALKRVIGSYGKTPNGATEIELRPNADGTLTPYTGKYPMADFESGEPIVMPAGTTDAQAADLIRKAGAVTKKDKFFGVKPDESSAAPAAGSEGNRGGAGSAAEPGAATQRPREELAAEAEQRVTGLKALLKCLTS